MSYLSFSSIDLGRLSSVEQGERIWAGTGDKQQGFQDSPGKRYTEAAAPFQIGKVLLSVSAWLFAGTKNVKLYFWLDRSEEIKVFVKGIVPSADIFVCL